MGYGLIKYGNVQIIKIVGGMQNQIEPGFTQAQLLNQECKSLVAFRRSEEKGILAVNGDHCNASAQFDSTGI